MSGFRFPFNWGSVPDAVSSTSSVAVTTRWTTVTHAVEPWKTLTSGLHRFERIYTQPAQTFGRAVNFSFQVQSQFPFRVQTLNGPVPVISTITNP